ncbi:MAG: putative toxin-antitoxin system toxin component, PIN family [Acidobacteria bacterium]|nr:putative toxin-antitoxin system toxin component, PIN family [Acidobacteriota bacterium]
MIRVVLDTNVVVSAHINLEGLEASVLDLVLQKRVALIVSAPVLGEYVLVLRREKIHLDPLQVEHSLTEIRKISVIVEPTRSVSAAADPADNRFLECADAAKADYLVTGNKRHFPKSWRKTEIVNARELLEIIGPQLKR